MTRIDRSWRASSAASSRPVIRGISMSVSTIVRPGRGPATARGARRPPGHDLDVRLGPTATARTSPGVAEGAWRNSRLPLAVVLDRWRPRSKGRGRTARQPPAIGLSARRLARRPAARGCNPRRLPRRARGPRTGGRQRGASAAPSRAALFPAARQATTPQARSRRPSVVPAPASGPR